MLSHPPPTPSSSSYSFFSLIRSHPSSSVSSPLPRSPPLSQPSYFPPPASPYLFLLSLPLIPHPHSPLFLSFSCSSFSSSQTSPSLPFSSFSLFSFPSSYSSRPCSPPLLLYGPFHSCTQAGNKRSTKEQGNRKRSNLKLLTFCWKRFFTAAQKKSLQMLL